MNELKKIKERLLEISNDFQKTKDIETMRDLRKSIDYLGSFIDNLDENEKDN